MAEICALCQSENELVDSHILPAFVFKWLKSRGASGHIRNSENPNKRVQDGLKIPLLCPKCEGILNVDETQFATKLFHLWLSGNQDIYYEEWLLRFCISISWRVLKYCRGRNKNIRYTKEQELLLSEAEVVWRNFLLKSVASPNKFEQHLLIFDLIAETTIEDLPSSINRFLTGAVTMDIVGSTSSLMTYAHLGRFVIFGHIQRSKDPWEGTKVNVNQGRLKPGSFTVPRGLLDLFKEKAAISGSMFDGISDAQQSKIDVGIRENIDKYVGSEQFQAIQADISLFGKSAVFRKPNSKGK